MSSVSDNPSYVESVLQQYGFQKIKKTSNGFIALCKFHDDRKHPSFSISNAGLWMCWACRVKGNMKMLLKRLGASDADWRDMLKMMDMQLDNSPYRIVERKRKKPVFGLPKDFKPYGSREDVPGYLKSRLKWETIKHFGLGFASQPWQNKWRVIIPVKHEGHIVGYHGRAIKPEIEPKYWNPTGFEIKDYIFNYEGPKQGGEVICVEGAFNAMSMWEKGFYNTVALFGTKFKSDQMKRLFSLAPSEIVICFDRDSKPTRPGQKATKAFGDLVSAVTPTYIMPLPIDKDPNILPASVLRNCYEKRVQYEKVFGVNQ